MYSFSNRFNAITYLFFWLLAGMSLVNFLTIAFNDAQPTVQEFNVVEDKYFSTHKYFKDQHYNFYFDLKADISSLYNWNTHLVFVYVTAEFETKHSKDENIVTLWDDIVLLTDSHQINLNRQVVEYDLTDIHKSLNNKKVQVYFNWQHCGVVGFH